MKDIIELQKMLDWLLEHESDFILLGLKNEFIKSIEKIRIRIDILESALINS